MNGNFDTLRSVNDQGEATITFARQSDGMIVGIAIDTVARFGEDPSASVGRAFIDHDSALKWVKDRCREMAGREDVEFFERAVERKLVTHAAAGQRRM